MSEGNVIYLAGERVEVINPRWADTGVVESSTHNWIEVMLDKRKIIIPFKAEELKRV